LLKIIRAARHTIHTVQWRIQDFINGETDEDEE